jgi:hypothetical protein
MAPHDETFTIQKWFDHEIPAVFVYEASPTARAFVRNNHASLWWLLLADLAFSFRYLKGGRAKHSSVDNKELITPAKYEVRNESVTPSFSLTARVFCFFFFWLLPHATMVRIPSAHSFG